MTQLSSDFLKQFRLRLGLSQQRLAEATGVSARRVAAWERGDGLPDAGQADRLIKLMRDLPSEMLDEVSRRALRFAARAFDDTAAEAAGGV